jgi:hypothetical protein
MKVNKFNDLKNDLNELTKIYKDSDNIKDLLDYTSLVIERLDGNISYCDNYLDNGIDDKCNTQLLTIPKVLPNTPDNNLWYSYYNKLFVILLQLFEQLNNSIIKNEEKDENKIIKENEKDTENEKKENEIKLNKDLILSEDKIKEVKEIIRDIYKNMIKTDKFTKEQININLQNISARICALRLANNLPINKKFCDPKLLK